MNMINTLYVHVVILWLMPHIFGHEKFYDPHIVFFQKFMTPVYLGPPSKENTSPLRFSLGGFRFQGFRDFLGLGLKW